MKIINLAKLRKERHVDRVEAIARSMIRVFQEDLQGTFRLADGRPIDLHTTQMVLCRHWRFPSDLSPHEYERVSLCEEIARLEEEESAVSRELYLSRRRLALLDCPFAELDIIEHASGVRGWVGSVDWCHAGFLVNVRSCGKGGRPIKGGGSRQLWGPADVSGWRVVGRVSPSVASRLGWASRSE